MSIYILFTRYLVILSWKYSTYLTVNYFKGQGQFIHLFIPSQKECLSRFKYSFYPYSLLKHLIVIITEET